MVKISYFPIKEVILHEVVKHEVSSFLRSATAKNINTVAWCEGMLLNFSHFQTNEKLVMSALEGIDHIATIDYCMVGKHQKKIKNDEFNIEVITIDQSNNKIVTEIAKFIKRNFENK